MRRTSAGRRLRWHVAAAPLHVLTVVLGMAFLTGCDRTVPSTGAPSVESEVTADSPLSAEFALPNGRIVQLDYLDSQNFRLTDSASATQTLIVGGEIYLHYPERDSQPERLWRYGELAPEQSRSSSHGNIVRRPTLIPPQGVAAWGDVGEVFDVEVRASGPLGIPIDATVARLPELANAQWRIATRLLPAMDMALCGDGVQQLTSWWDPALAGEGWAILATSAGIRLNGPVTQLAGTPSLPAGVEARPLPTGDDR